MATQSTKQDMFGSLVGAVLYASSGDTAANNTTGGSSNDDEKLRLFFVTYRQFGSPSDLLKALRVSFKASTQHDPSATKKRIGGFLLKWIENCPEDFVAEKKLGEDMLAFARANLSASMTNHLKLNYVRASRQPADDCLAMARTPFETTRPRDIAFYFTLLDWRHFSAIKANELFDVAWRKPNKEEAAPHITSLTQRFNTISLWLADLVVESYGRSAHTAVVEKIVEVLKELFKLNNFSSGMAVMSALHNASVQRLKGLWTGVRKEHRDCFLHFELFMTPTDNFKNYRKHMVKLSEANRKSQTKTPAIPFLALFLRDMTFIHDGNSDTTEDDQFNLEKLELQGRQLLQLQEWQKNPFTFHFVCDQAYLSFFDHMEALQEDDIFAKSLRVQPNLTDSNRQTTTKLRQSFEADGLSLDGSLVIDLTNHRLNTEWDEYTDDDAMSVGEAEADLLSTVFDVEEELVAAQQSQTGQGSRRRRSTTKKSPTAHATNDATAMSHSTDHLPLVRPSAPSPPSSSSNNDGAEIVSSAEQLECPVLRWKVHEVSDWLRRAFLSQHIGAFGEARVDGVKLLQIDHKFLSSIGVSTFKERKTVLMRIATLKQEHGVEDEPGKDVSEVATPRSLTLGSTSAPIPQEPTPQQLREVQVVTIRRLKLSDEASADHHASPGTLGKTSSTRLLSSTTSPTHFAGLTTVHTVVTPRDSDVSALGGASVLVCYEDDKWDSGRLGPFSYDRLLQTILSRYGHVFSEPGQVGIVCPDIKKGGMKIRSDKDLRKLKQRAKDRQAQIVVLNIAKQHKKKTKSRPSSFL